MVTLTFDEFYGISLRFGIWFGIGMFFTILFSYFRPQKPEFYAPKATTKHQKIAELSPSFLSWMTSYKVLNETRNVDKIGQDAVMFLQFMRLGVVLFSKLAVIAIPLILVNYYAPVIMNTIPTNKTIPALTLLTMGNIQKGSGLFYLHAGYTYLTTFMVFYGMYQIWLFYLSVRQEYFNSAEYRDEECHSVLMFRNLTVQMRSKEAIRRYCEKYGVVMMEEHVKLGKHLQGIRWIVEEHSKKVMELETLLARLFSTTTTEKWRITRYYFTTSKEKLLNDVKKLQPEIQKLEKEIERIRSQDYEHFENAPYAFIAFDSVSSAHHSLFLLEKGPVDVMLAKRPNDIVWRNIEVEPENRKTRLLIALCYNSILYVFWFCFVWFIGTFKKPSRLHRIWPSFETLLETNTPLRIFFESYLGPVCVIITNFILLPRAMTKISDIQMKPSMTDNGHSSLRKFYTFLFYQRVLEVLMPLGENIFLNMGSGQSFSTAISNAWASFSNVFVANGSTYIDVMVRGFNSYGMEIVQGAPLFWYYLAKNFQSSSPRTLKTLSDTREFQYMKTYGFAQFLFLVCISYSIVAPFVLLPTVIVFTFGYIIMKYQLFFVYHTHREGGGEWWNIAFSLLCISMAFFQTVTFLSLGTIAGIEAPPSIYVTVLPFITFGFWYVCTRYFGPKGRFEKESRSMEGVKSVPCKLQDPCYSKELFAVWVDDQHSEKWEQLSQQIESSVSDSETLATQEIVNT